MKIQLNPLKGLSRLAVSTNKRMSNFLDGEIPCPFMNILV